MNKNKILILSIILILSMTLLSVVSAKEMQLEEGSTLNIPDDYYTTYQDDDVYVEVYEVCKMTVLEVELLNERGKEEFAHVGYSPKDYRINVIGDKKVYEYYYGQIPNGFILYEYFVDTDDSTICYMAAVDPHANWNVQEMNNPIHRIILAST